MTKVLRDGDIVRVAGDAPSVADSGTSWLIGKDGDSCTLVNGSRVLLSLAVLEEVDAEVPCTTPREGGDGHSP
ncbi:hypothetical protein ABZT27_31815 [Streptomyces sp. NPDC005389]|uniref:hypothetical protein n=1 Tax=unclassified Streptomyces TaxID=2593676 RepID=UPI0033BF1AF8